MGKKSFNTVEGLQREIMKRANKALKNEVKDYVEDKMKSHVSKMFMQPIPLLNMNVVKPMADYWMIQISEMLYMVAF